MADPGAAIDQPDAPEDPEPPIPDIPQLNAMLDGILEGEFGAIDPIVGNAERDNDPRDAPAPPQAARPRDALVVAHVDEELLVAVGHLHEARREHVAEEIRQEVRDERQQHLEEQLRAANEAAEAARRALHAAIAVAEQARNRGDERMMEMRIRLAREGEDRARAEVAREAAEARLARQRLAAGAQLLQYIRPQFPEPGVPPAIQPLGDLLAVPGAGAPNRAAVEEPAAVPPAFHGPLAPNLVHLYEQIFERAAAARHVPPPVAPPPARDQRRDEVLMEMLGRIPLNDVPIEELLAQVAPPPHAPIQVLNAAREPEPLFVPPLAAVPPPQLAPEAIALQAHLLRLRAEAQMNADRLELDRQQDERMRIMRGQEPADAGREGAAVPPEEREEQEVAGQPAEVVDRLLGMLDEPEEELQPREEAEGQPAAAVVQELVNQAVVAAAHDVPDARPPWEEPEAQRQAAQALAGRHPWNGEEVEGAPAWVPIQDPRAFMMQQQQADNAMQHQQQFMRMLRLQAEQRAAAARPLNAEEAARREETERARREAAEAQRAAWEAEREDNDLPENLALRYSRACNICLKENPRRRAVMVACGHCCCCLPCAEEMLGGRRDGLIECFVCRARTGFVRLWEDLEHEMAPQAGQQPEVADTMRKRGNDGDDEGEQGSSKRSSAVQ